MSSAKDSLEFFKKTSKEMFLNNGSHQPLFFMGTPEGYCLMPAFFQNNLDKDAVAVFLKNLIAEGKVNSLVFVAEAWMKTVSDKKEVKKTLDIYGNLSNAPKEEKEEALILQYQSFDESYFYISKIKRDGDKVTLADWEEIKDQSKKSVFMSTGRFDGLFEKANVANN